MKIYLINSESYLLANEEIDKIVKSNNITTFDTNINTIEEIIIEAGYLSMFQEEKYIIVKNANFFGTGKINDKDQNLLLNYLDNPNPLATLIFLNNEKPDMRKKITKIIKEKYQLITIPNLKYYEIENRVANYFKKINLKIDNETLKYIVANSQNNYDLTMKEVAKIELYYSSGDIIKYYDITQIISKNINTNNFLFIDALIEGNIEKSLMLLEDIKLTKTEPNIIISLIARDIRIMLNIKKLLNENKREYEILKVLNLQDWQLDKYLKKAFPYKIAELEEILVKLAELDLDIKSGKKDRYTALELLILEMGK